MTLMVIGIILMVLIIGFIKILMKLSSKGKEIDFTADFRNKFVQFTNQYLNPEEKEKFNYEQYYWLTKNVNRIQSNIGFTGMMDYIAPFRTHVFQNYQIILNTLPKFRDGSVEPFEINSVDDALIRYIGDLEESHEYYRKKIWNPLIWFQEGIIEILGIPLLLLNSFGILSQKSMHQIKQNLIFRIITGIIGLITFLAAIVTIIQGKEQTIEFIQNLF